MADLTPTIPPTPPLPPLKWRLAKYIECHEKLTNGEYCPGTFPANPHGLNAYAEHLWTWHGRVITQAEKDRITNA